jgi:hypothetical protein
MMCRDLPDFTPSRNRNLKHRSAAEVFLRMHRRGEGHLPVLPAHWCAPPGSAVYDLEPYRLRPWHRAHHAQDEDELPRMEIPAQGQGRAVYPGPELTAQNSTRAGEDRDGRACVSLAGALEIAAGAARRKTDRSLPRNVQKRGPPRRAELRTARRSAGPNLRGWRLLREIIFA